MKEFIPLESKFDPLLTGSLSSSATQVRRGSNERQRPACRGEGVRQNNFAAGRGVIEGGGPKTNVPKTAELCNSAPRRGIHPPTRPTRKHASRRSCPTLCRSVLLDSHSAGPNWGAEGGHRQNGKTAPQFVHKTLPVGNHAIWASSPTVTLCAH